MKELRYSGLAVAVALALGTATVPAWAGEARSGFYIGLGAGVVEAAADPGGTLDTELNGSTSHQPDWFQGYDAQLLAGFQKQVGAAVVGITGDVDLSKKVTLGEVDKLGNYDGTCQSGDVCADAGVYGSTQSHAHIRALIGIPITPELMLFGTAGVAYGHVELDGLYAAAGAGPGLYSSTALGGTTARNAFGPSFSVGADWSVTDNFAVRSEAIYDSYHLDFPQDQRYGLGAGASNAVTGDSAYTSANIGPSARFGVFTIREAALFRF